MLAAGGAIVNTGSVAAFRARPGFAAYTASKAAVAMLTRQAALEYADDGIRVNAVAPGLIDTPLIGDLTPAIRAEAAARIPLGRLGTPEEVAALVTFLLSGAAS
jgi:NAD(P)-dependent dehydrogenase (short-subunit alcohol dehydrogenase family)